MFATRSSVLPTADEALPGRTTPMRVPTRHFVTGHRMVAPFPDGCRTVVLGLGCFWGAERKFWQTEGVYATAVGYAGGHTPNPTYDEVSTEQTAHAEVVLVVYDPTQIPLEGVLRVFWETHNPTMGMRQGNDVGTPYRSAIYVADDHEIQVAESSRDLYQAALTAAGHGRITTEIKKLTAFYYAEEYHQQYLAKNPNGYCGIGGCGVPFKLAELPVGEKA